MDETLTANEILCLQALLELDDKNGNNSRVHEAEEVAALAGLNEHDVVVPALHRLSDLGGCIGFKANQGMPWRFQLWRPTALELLAIDPDYEPTFFNACPRERLSELAAR